MGGLFGGPKAPPPPPPPTPPVEPPSMDEAKSARSREDELRKRAGRASTVLSQGDALSTNSAKTGTRKLLGG